VIRDGVSCLNAIGSCAEGLVDILENNVLADLVSLLREKQNLSEATQRHVITTMFCIVNNAFTVPFPGLKKRAFLAMNMVFPMLIDLVAVMESQLKFEVICGMNRMLLLNQVRRSLSSERENHNHVIGGRSQAILKQEYSFPRDASSNYEESFV
jgi:hypothetical protein